MVGNVGFLERRRSKLRRDESEAVLAALDRAAASDPFYATVEGQRALAAHRADVLRRTAAATWEVFGMLVLAANRELTAALVAYSKRPLVAVRLWALCLEHMDWDSEEVMLSRSALAQELGVDPRDVSQVVSELVRLKVLGRKRRDGLARYEVSPWMATHRTLTGELDAARARWPRPDFGALAPERGEVRRHHAPFVAVLP